MRYRGRQTEASIHAVERRKREDEASRLKEQVPRLLELRLEISEHQGEGSISAARHTRHIVVDRAPALFEIPCTDTNCKEGGHDLTREILQSLRKGSAEFGGEDTCPGGLGSGVCRRVLRYTAKAVYSA